MKTKNNAQAIDLLQTIMSSCVHIEELAKDNRDVHENTISVLRGIDGTLNDISKSIKAGEG